MMVSIGSASRSYCFMAVMLLSPLSHFPTVFASTSANDPPGSHDVSAHRRAIIGGTIAPQGKFPYVASLVSASGAHTCGGSLIANDTVLSAAHCFGAFERVELGRYNIDDEDEEFESYSVRQIVRHPLYGSNTGSESFDLMLIKLDGVSSLPSVRLNDDAGAPNVDGASLVVAGWGDIDPRAYVQELADELREVEVKYVPNDECAEAYGSNLITDDMMCAADIDEDSCQGDSGGPLIVHAYGDDDPSNDVQVGVVSWGTGCADPNYPGVYARVGEEYDWIVQNLCALSDYPPDYINCTYYDYATVRIQFDQYPTDIGMKLEDNLDDTVLFDRPTSSYGNSLALQTIYERIPIYSKERGDQTYRFTIEDSYGDGLCCSQGDGSYELHIGDVVEGQPLLSGSIFERKEVWLIEVPSLSSPAATLQPEDDDDDTPGNTIPWWCYIWAC
mmetsp:Transcript_12604/g.16867  ORF Transcript_12604/g.16867 Transcript_12604/m.16867 type:complete len:445 (-) Transcript_12604:257-1591(-)